MITPREYQTSIISTAMETIAETGRTLIVMASGTGKTLTSAFTVKQMRQEGEKVLFVCHNADILRQAIEEYRKVFTHAFRWGMIVGEEKGYSNEPFLFATFQSMREWKHAFQTDEFAFVVVDESHHGQAVTYRETIEYFRPTRGLIGLTATPDREDGKDIRDLFGDEKKPLVLEEALAKKFVTPVSYKLMTVGSLSKAALKQMMKEVDEGNRRVSLKQLNETIFVEKRDEEIAKAILEHQGRGIIFCESILHAENFAQYLPDALPYHCKLQKRDIQDRLETFRNGNMRFLLAVDKFNEGVDIPDAELVVFLRSTDSMTVFLQQLGRGLRLSSNKRQVTVLDFVANAERIEYVARMKDRIRSFLPTGSNTLDKDIWQLDGAGIDFSVTDEIVNLTAILQRIRTPPYENYEDALGSARNLGFRTEIEYLRGYRQDPRLPSNPFQVYKTNGWISWNMFLRNEAAREFFQTYEEATRAARALGCRTTAEYARDRYKNPRLPSQPNDMYRNRGWISWAQFLGTDPFVSYEQASQVVNELKLRTRNQYLAECEKNPHLPRKPDIHYKNLGWVAWVQFLHNFYPSCEEAAQAARRLGITSAGQYIKKRKEDLRLPAHPDITYKRCGWVSWKDFLGTNSYQTYEEAERAVRKLRILRSEEYQNRYKEDSRLPSAPNRIYKDIGWIDWAEFLGTNPYETCEEAATATQSLGIKTQREYYKLYRQNPRLPSSPDRVYKDIGWTSWSHFLGKTKR